MKRIFFVIIIGILVLSPFFVSAAGLVPCGGKGEPACQLCHFFVLFKNAVDFLLKYVVPALAVLMLAIGGFMYVFAFANPSEGMSGSPGMVSQAKRLIVSVVFGPIIIFAAWLIVNLFFQLIGVQDRTGLA